MLTLERLAARRIRIRGLVQGVGFRPSMHRLATALGLNGWVCNDDEGVLIHVEGPQPALDAFTRCLPKAIPFAARVEAIAEEPAASEEADDFRILVQATANTSSILARIPNDSAMCADCRADVLDPANRRFRHPFASCTNCGPRYSIIQEMPYERHLTSMAGFCLCPKCGAEYENAGDRRFHAEPIACSTCGPRLNGSDHWQSIAARRRGIGIGQDHRDQRTWRVSVSCARGRRSRRVATAGAQTSSGEAVRGNGALDRGGGTTRAHLAYGT